MKAALLGAAVLGLTATPLTAHAQDDGLPAGPGKQELVDSCNVCHAAEQVAVVRRDKDGWSAVVDDMVGRGASVTDAQYDLIVSYLVKNFGVEAAAAPAAAAPAAVAAAPKP